jgi:hypothetical protein
MMFNDQQRADHARWAYYNIGAQMCGPRPGQCMYPAAAYYARTGPRLPHECPGCGQLQELEGPCPRCCDVDRAPQGETVRLFEPAPAPKPMPGQIILVGADRDGLYGDAHSPWCPCLQCTEPDTY